MKLSLSHQITISLYAYARATHPIYRLAAQEFSSSSGGASSRRVRPTHDDDRFSELGPTTALFREQIAQLPKTPRRNVHCPWFRVSSSSLLGDSGPAGCRSVFLADAAALLGVSLRTVYYRIRQGKLVTIRTRGGSQRALVESVEALLREQSGESRT